MDNKNIFKEIIRFLKKEGAKKISIFGSYARDEETLKSDIDIIVEFKEKKVFLI